MPDFEIHDGKKYAIIYRKKGSEITDSCPFCGKSHRHGEVLGHRIAHCEDKLIKGKNHPSPKSCLLSDGTKAFREDGYLLREY